jgi:hypothetical protein
MCSSEAPSSVHTVDTIHRGNAAEAGVLYKLTTAGIHVLVPFGGGLAFDLVAVVPPAGELLRIQVKSGRVRRGTVRFNAYSTDHGFGQRTYEGRADVIAVYVRELDEVFIVPVEDCPRSEGCLRLDAAKNNQRRRIRLAAHYSVDRWIRDITHDEDRDHLRHAHAEGQP